MNFVYLTQGIRTFALGRKLAMAAARSEKRRERLVFGDDIDIDIDIIPSKLLSAGERSTRVTILRSALTIRTFSPLEMRCRSNPELQKVLG